jgi:hypothetical protein
MVFSLLGMAEKLASVAIETEAAIQLVVEEAAGLVETGELRDSIEKTIGHHVAWVGTDDDKAVWQEFGTSTIPAASMAGPTVTTASTLIRASSRNARIWSRKAIVPDYALSSHVAPLGLVFDTADGLPQKYRGGAFVGEHGSWDRPTFNGFKVVFVPFRSGHPDGKAEDVVTDFLDAEGRARGRPVGLALDKSGALLIADDVGNTVWRVTSAGQ